MSNYIYVILHSSLEHGDCPSLVCAFSDKDDADDWINENDYGSGNHYFVKTVDLDNTNYIH